jgi:hypothetical protein
MKEMSDMTNASRTIAVVGTGVIGASWAAYYLSRGFKVPRPTLPREPKGACAPWSMISGPHWKPSASKTAQPGRT